MVNRWVRTHASSDQRVANVVLLSVRVGQYFDALTHCCFLLLLRWSVHCMDRKVEVM
jgi:hypothetical protein